MSVFFKTWDEIADYVTSSKGYDYLTNPSEWLNSFKEIAKDSRYIGDNTYYNPDGFYQVEDWLSKGKDITSGLEGGSKSVPAVNTVITNTTTGAVEAGAAAAALEQTGITVTLSAAGWVATALTGLGLGVAAYEVAPEFWTDLSNAIFEPITGEHLTYDETEPFLRKKLTQLLSTDSNGDIVTYADADMIERAYNFIKTHIQSTGYDIVDDFTWSVYTPPTPFYGRYAETTPTNQSTSKSFDVEIGKISLTDDLLQSVVHQTYQMITRAGISEAEISTRGIVNNLRELYPNYNNANLYHVKYAYYYTSPTVQTRSIYIDGFNVPNTDNVVTAKPHYTGYNSWQRYLREDANQSQASNDDYGYMLDIYDKNDQLVNPTFDFLFSYQYDVDTQTGTVKDTGTSYVFDGFFELGYLPGTGGTTNLFSCAYSTVSPKVGTDNYLERNGVKIVGRTPVNSKSIVERYPSWYTNKKTTGQPSKDGTVDKVKDHLPINLPLNDSDTDKILQHGVNYDQDSYNDDPENNKQGKDTPDRAPVDRVNDSIDDNVRDYNRSDVDPNTAPEPAEQPLPDYPVDPPVDTSGDSGESPTPSSMAGVTASGMVSVYNPTKQQLIDFSAWLWSPNFLDNFLKIFANPMDAIIGLHIMYATPITGNSENIVCGYLDSGVSSKVVTQQYSKVSCGTISLPEYYGNATDYEPYTTVHIYLPFVGIMPLKANDVLGKQLTVEYGVDAMTGTCLAMLTTKKGNSEIQCYTFAGNCATQIPISGGNYGQMIMGLAGFLTAGVGAVATGNPLMALGAGAAFMSGNVSVQHSGAIGSNAGACGIRKPYVIITRKKAYNASNYSSFYGYPANMNTTLRSCKGYTKVKHVHIEDMDVVTDSEKTEIETLLKEGVIIQ